MRRRRRRIVRGVRGVMRSDGGGMERWMGKMGMYLDGKVLVAGLLMGVSGVLKGYCVGML